MTKYELDKEKLRAEIEASEKRVKTLKKILSRMDENQPEARLEAIAKSIHYPECWDTACYPTLEIAVSELFECNADECEQKKGGE